MKTIKIISPIALAIILASCSGNQGGQAKQEQTNATVEVVNAGSQAGVDDNESQMNIVKVAVASKDHSTLVAAVKAAELVDVLASSGPYTVFAPTNAAFDLLPKGTVEGLLVPEKKNDLANILQYHVTVPVLKDNMLKDGQKLGMANGDNAVITIKDGKMMVNDANIIGSVMASNGIIYVIDKVLLPPVK